MYTGKKEKGKVALRLIKLKGIHPFEKLYDMFRAESFVRILSKGIVRELLSKVYQNF